MSPEQFLKLTKGKKIWWGCRRELNRRLDSILNNEEYLIVKDLNGNRIIPTDDSPAYARRNHWAIETGLYDAKETDVSYSVWFILDGEFMDEFNIKKYNSALKNIDNLLKSGKVEVNTDGTLKLKTGSKDK